MAMKSELEKVMTKEEFFHFMEEAGFKSKRLLAEYINLPYTSVNCWGSVNAFPSYSRVLMESLVKARKYDNLLQSNSIFLQVEALEQEKKALQERIAVLESEKREFEDLKKHLKLFNGFKKMENENA